MILLSLLRLKNDSFMFKFLIIFLNLSDTKDIYEIDES